MQEKIKHILASSLEFIGFAIMFLYSWLVSLLLKEKDVVVTFFVLMMIDTTLGIIASIKRKIKITSIRLAFGISFKLIMFLVVAILGIFIKHYAGIDVVKPLVLLGAIVEAISIKENLEIIYETDILQSIIDKIKRQFKYKKDIKEIYDNIKDIKNASRYDDSNNQ